MSVDFSQIVKQAYQGAEDFQVKDSQVHEHITKVKAAVSIILKNYTRYSAQFFEQKSREWKTELTEAQNKLANRTCLDASNVFYLSDGVAHAMKDLNKSVFTTEEREWLAKEAASILAYLEEVQADYIDFLKGFDQEAVDAKVQVFKDGMEKLKAWIPEVPVKPFTNKEAPTPAELESSDLVALSPKLQSLEENQERLMTLKQSAEEMCAQLEAWKQAVESGQPFEGEIPSSDVFQALVQKVEALSFRAVVIPEGLLEKVSLCSRVAGRALQQVAETSERFCSGLQNSHNALLNKLKLHEQWQNLSMREHLPSPEDLIGDLNPNSSIRAQLEAVSWLHTLPEAQLNNIERSFAILSQREQVEFKQLLDDSTNISEFLQKLKDLYSEKLEGLTEEKGTLEAQVRDLKEAVSAGAQSQTELENLRKDLAGRNNKLGSLGQEKVKPEAQVKELESQVSAGAQSQTDENLRVDLENLRVDLEKRNSELKNLEEEKVDLEAQVKELKEAGEDLENLREELSYKKGELNARNERIQNLEEENRRLSESRKSEPEVQPETADHGHVEHEGPNLQELKTQRDGLEKRLLELDRQRSEKETLIQTWAEQKRNLEPSRFDHFITTLSIGASTVLGVDPGEDPYNSVDRERKIRGLDELIVRARSAEVELRHTYISLRAQKNQLSNQIHELEQSQRVNTHRYEMLFIMAHAT